MTGARAGRGDRREERRLAELRDYSVLDRPADGELTAVVRLAAAVVNVPTATLNLIDEDRQCQLAAVGFPGGDSARADSMCAVRFLEGRTVWTADAAEHPDYADNPWVTGRHGRVRFYASVPLVTPAGNVLGTLCLFDSAPRGLSEAEMRLLEDAAAVVVALFERRRQARVNAHLAAEADEQRDLLAHTVALLEARQEFTDAVLDTIDVGVVAADDHGRLTLFNRAARDWHGLEADPRVDPGRHPYRYDLYAADGVTLLTPRDVPLAIALHEGSVTGAEMVIAPQDRAPVRVVTSGRALLSGDGTVLGAVVAMTDVTAARERQAALEAAHAALAERNAELAHLAHHDSLTGLPNRALLRDRLEHALARAARTGRVVALLFLDLDDFKMVNDSLGHETGDRVLVHTARVLVQSLRETDTAARLGGDEFVVLLDDLPSAADAHQVAARVALALGEPMTVDGLELTVAASIGVATSAPGSTAESLLRSADGAMYRAKRGVTAAVVAGSAAS